MPIMVPGFSTCVAPFAIESDKGWFERDDPFERFRPVGAQYNSSGLVERMMARSSQWSRHGYWHNAVVRDLDEPAPMMLKVGDRESRVMTDSVSTPAARKMRSLLDAPRADETR